jgi:sensor histidine kinase regulating citrate/malate metabolism
MDSGSQGRIRLAAKNKVGNVQKKVVLSVSLFLFVFIVVLAYLWISNLKLKESLKKDLKARITNQGKDLQKHRKIKEDIRRSLEEKYRADMVSSRVVTKRLEQAQNKEKDLKVKGGGK